MVVVDEAHHATAKSYRRVLEHFEDAKRLGVTATPDRLDGDRLGNVFETVAYTYEIADAIADRYLVPIRGRVVYDKALDLTRVRRTAGDFNAKDLSEVMSSEPALALVAKAVAEQSGDRPTIVFAVDVGQARELAKTINLIKPGTAEAIDGTASEGRRADVLRRFRAGAIQYVVNCALYTEGVDVPEASCVAIARPTMSRALYAQMVGRGTRLLGVTMEESVAAGKEDMLVLDFVGATGRHQLVSCLDIFDGNTDSAVRRRAMQRAQSGDVLIQEALDGAAQEINDEERAKALRSASYRSVDIRDPYTILGVRPRPGRGGGRPATKTQLVDLARHNIPGAAAALKALEEGKPLPASAPDYHQAMETLRAIGVRRQQGLASVRQAGQLLRLGLNPDAPADAAKAAMNKLAAAKWRPSPALVAELQSDPRLRVPAT
ncbi:MAG: helicase-related protein [Acidobacteriota bacterium]